MLSSSVLWILSYALYGFAMLVVGYRFGQSCCRDEGLREDKDEKTPLLQPELKPVQHV